MKVRLLTLFILAPIIAYGQTYMGVSDAGCSCHVNGPELTQWKLTKHAVANNIDSDEYGYNCLQCHNTGWDPTVDNGGADEYVEEAPGQTPDYIITDQTNFERVEHVQCEACHGPVGDASGNLDFTHMTREPDYSSENCGTCHQGEHQPYLSEWQASPHSDLESGQTSASCAPCHNGVGFIEYVDGGKQGLSEDVPELVDITCAACHDPHDATNESQLRTVEVTLTNGEEITSGGKGKLCMNCHRTRRDAVEYTNDYLNNISSHYGPHLGAQADVLSGKNYPDMGTTFEITNHLGIISNSCVSCHMNSDGDGTGGHTFRMSTEDGGDNVAACTPCHQFESFDAVTFTYNDTEDLDGDGTAEGLQNEVHGMLEEIAMLLPPVNSEDINTIDSTWSLLEAKAFYIYEMVENDGSFGLHNAKFIVGMLDETVSQLKAAVDVKDVEGVVTDYRLEQNYPNPFNPSTEIRFALPKASNVTLTIYDALGNEIDVIAKGYMEAGNHKAEWNAGSHPSGVYLYKIETGDFMMVKKMMLLK